MNTNIEEERKRILTILETETNYQSIPSTAQKTRINRHTATSHLDLLEILGKVRKIEHGTAKKYLSATNLPISGLIDISSDLILIFNSHLNIQYLNIPAARYFMTRLNATIGKKLGDLHFSLLSGYEISQALINRSSILIKNAFLIKNIYRLNLKPRMVCRKTSKKSYSISEFRIFLINYGDL